jgi:hypothetical protein
MAALRQTETYRRLQVKMIEGLRAMKHIRLVEMALILALLCASAVLAQDCDWTGTWNTDYGQMVLQQSGSTVTGTYTSNQGQIQGTASGSKLTGTWSEAPSRAPPGDAGDIEFTMSDDCNSFSGNWRYGSSGDWSGSWGGTKPPFKLQI